MKMWNLIGFIFVFLVIGEIIIRIDDAFDPVGNVPKAIVVEIEQSTIKQEVDDLRFNICQDQFRVLIIGDSYIYGGGIEPSKKFSKVLQKKLDKIKSSGTNIIILDVSRPRNNTTDNFNTFTHYYKSFKPNVVIWAYNYNDIFGVSEIIKDTDTPASDVNSKASSPPKITINKVSRLKQFKNVVYANSRVMNYVPSKLQKELKLKSIVLPFGDFYYLTKKGYIKENREWIISQNLLLDAMHICQKEDIEFILYKMPEFNLLSNNSLFKDADRSLLNFSNENPDIHFIDGYNDFDVLKESKYMLSKYDGHPNEVAHDIIAEKMVIELSKYGLQK